MTFKQKIIDAIPPEGALQYTAELSGRDYSFTQEEANNIIDSFFKGKTPPAVENQNATILLGGPGSGKSYLAASIYDTRDDKENTIYVSYDETGAIFAIPGYQRNLKALLGLVSEHKPISEPNASQTLEARTEIWDNYRKFSQHIRNGVLKRALREGFSIICLLYTSDAADD